MTIQDISNAVTDMKLDDSELSSEGVANFVDMAVELLAERVNKATTIYEK